MLTKAKSQQHKTLTGTFNPSPPSCADPTKWAVHKGACVLHLMRPSPDSDETVCLCWCCSCTWYQCRHQTLANGSPTKTCCRNSKTCEHKTQAMIHRNQTMEQARRCCSHPWLLLAAGGLHWQLSSIGLRASAGAVAERGASQSGRRAIHKPPVSSHSITMITQPTAFTVAAPKVRGPKSPGDMPPPLAKT